MYGSYGKGRSRPRRAFSFGDASGGDGSNSSSIWEGAKDFLNDPANDPRYHPPGNNQPTPSSGNNGPHRMSPRNSEDPPKRKMPLDNGFTRTALVGVVAGLVARKQAGKPQGTSVAIGLGAAAAYFAAGFYFTMSPSTAHYPLVSLIWGGGPR